MRLFFSVSSFAFTMIVALVIFTYMLIEAPTTMRSLIASANYLRSQVLDVGLLPDRYMVWADILLQANQILLIGFSVTVRIVIAIVGSLLNRATAVYPDAVPSPNEPAGSSRSPFSHWG